MIAKKDLEMTRVVSEHIGKKEDQETFKLAMSFNDMKDESRGLKITRFIAEDAKDVFQ